MKELFIGVVTDTKDKRKAQLSLGWPTRKRVKYVFLLSAYLTTTHSRLNWVFCVWSPIAVALNGVRQNTGPADARRRADWPVIEGPVKSPGQERDKSGDERESTPPWNPGLADTDIAKLGKGRQATPDKGVPIALGGLIV